MSMFEDDNVLSVTARLNVPGVGDFTVAWGGENQMLAIEGVSRDQLKQLLSKLRVQHKLSLGTQQPVTLPVGRSPDTVFEASLETAAAQPEVAKETPTSAKAKAKPAEPPVANTSEDLAVFLTFQKLADVVTEVMRRGAKDYDTIKGYIEMIRGAEACPLLDRIEKQGDFESRLRQHCASRKIEGAL